MDTETFQVKYEVLNPNAKCHIEYGSTLTAFVELQDKLVKYYDSEKGRQSRQSNNKVLIINEILHDGSRIETRMRTRDLYVLQVAVFNSNNNLIVQEVDDGVIGGYNRGTIIIPIQYYIDRSKYSSPGALIRSQAFRISESLRFRRSLRHVQLTGGRGHAEMWPEFETRHSEKGRFETRYITPFEYASIHRADPIDFGMFHVFYGNWEDLSDRNSPIVAISQKVRNN